MRGRAVRRPRAPTLWAPRASPALPSRALPPMALLPGRHGPAGSASSPWTSSAGRAKTPTSGAWPSGELEARGLGTS
eukprot:1739101-Alexandrium_andersonii.AAC.1